MKQRLGLGLKHASEVDQTLLGGSGMRRELVLDALLQLGDGDGLGDSGELDAVSELLGGAEDLDVDEPARVVWGRCWRRIRRITPRHVLLVRRGHVGSLTCGLAQDVAHVMRERWVRIG